MIRRLKSLRTIRPALALGLCLGLVCFASTTLAQDPPRGTGGIADPPPIDPTAVPSFQDAFPLDPAEEAEEDAGVLRIEVGDDGTLSVVEILDVPLAEALRELVRVTGWNLVATSKAARRQVSIYLQNVDVETTASLLAASTELVLRREPGRVLRFLEPDEYRVDWSRFRREETRVFTLLYPNAIEVAEAISTLYGDRLIVSFGDPGREAFRELEQRFDRFDLIDGRSQGLGETFGGGTNVTTGSGNRRTTADGFDAASARGIGTEQRQRDRLRDRNSIEDVLREELGREDLQALEDERTQEPAEGQVRRIDQLAAQASTIHLTVLRRLNRIVIRANDEHAIDEIGELIRRLDVPTPLVMLEVKILRIELDDGMTSAFDFTYTKSDASGSFSTGEIVPSEGTGLLPGGGAFNARAGIFQVVSNHFAARLQLLESRGKVTALATPLILTANAEVSRIFSGQRVPLVVGFTEPQLVVGDGATTTLQASPVTELTDVGTQLLLTANINADRTVMLRLLQENSSILPDGATILIPVGDRIEEQTIDVLQTQTSSGTIVGEDGKLVAFGGLIEEVLTDQREQLPVLGDIPLVGFLFKREEVRSMRSELVVLVRPYVLDTPVDGDRISRELLDELSIHPIADDPAANLDRYDDDDALGAPEARHDLLHSLNFHTLPESEEEQP